MKLNKGRKHSEEHKKNISNSLKGKFLNIQHPRWVGGSRSYFSLIAKKTMEKYLQRDLKFGEVVHHLDYNWKNNNINNLYLFNTKSEHTKYHRYLHSIVKEMIGLTGVKLKCL